MQHSFIKDFSSRFKVTALQIYIPWHGSLIILLKGANESFNWAFNEKIEKDKADFQVAFIVEQG